MKLPVQISTPNAPKAIGPYSQGMRVGGMLYLSGQIPLDPATGNIVGETIEDQTTRVMQNISGILNSQGLTMANIVKSTVFLTNLAEFGGMNEVYAKHFGPDFPARSTIQVAALPRGASVEIEVVAHY